MDGWTEKKQTGPILLPSSLTWSVTICDANTTMNSNLLDSCLQVLYKEFPQVVQRLQLLGYGLLQTLEILACLLATVHLQ